MAISSLDVLSDVSTIVVGVLSLLVAIFVWRAGITALRAQIRPLIAAAPASSEPDLARYPSGKRFELDRGQTHVEIGYGCWFSIVVRNVGPGIARIEAAWIFENEQFAFQARKHGAIARPALPPGEFSRILWEGQCGGSLHEYLLGLQDSDKGLKVGIWYANANGEQSATTVIFVAEQGGSWVLRHAEINKPGKGPEPPKGVVAPKPDW
jgi:hypothetical protein